MPADNLATCLMPSLFYLQHSNNKSITRISLVFFNNFIFVFLFSRRKTIGVPSERERNAYSALKEIFAKMIINYEKLLSIPNDLENDSKFTIPSLYINTDLQISIKNGMFNFQEEFFYNFRQSLNKLKKVFSLFFYSIIYFNFFRNIYQDGQIGNLKGFIMMECAYLLKKLIMKFYQMSFLFKQMCKFQQIVYTL